MRERLQLCRRRDATNRSVRDIVWMDLVHIQRDAQRVRIAHARWTHATIEDAPVSQRKRNDPVVIRRRKDLSNGIDRTQWIKSTM